MTMVHYEFIVEGCTSSSGSHYIKYLNKSELYRLAEHFCSHRNLQSDLESIMYLLK